MADIIRVCSYCQGGHAQATIIRYSISHAGKKTVDLHHECVPIYLALNIQPHFSRVDALTRNARSIDRAVPRKREVPNGSV